MNKHYQYEHMELWNGELWKEKHSSISSLVTWIGEHEPEGISRPAPLPCPVSPDPKGLPCFQLKTYSVDDPEVIREWKEKGLCYKSLEMGGMFWIPMVPAGAASSPDRRYPVLMVVHKEDHSDPYWAMRTLSYYRSYNEAAARNEWILLYIVPDNRPDRNREYVNVLQEALVLFPCDLNRIFLDVSVVYQSGNTLSDIPGFCYADSQGVPAEDPDSSVVFLDSIPMLNISRRWENRDSLNRSSVVEERFSDASYVPEQLIHSPAARKMMEAVSFEYQFSHASDQDLADYWSRQGLDLEIHEMRGERWAAMVPHCVYDGAGLLEKLPVLLIMQEVSASNSHSLVAAFGAFFEYCQIAAAGEAVLVFFALESPDDNDLLLDILHEAAVLYPIDTTRAYITGHSHNGHFSMEFARRHPKAIAAAATLGNFAGLPAPQWCYDAVPVPDEKIDLMSTFDLPVINISGCCEMRSIYPLNAAAGNMRSEQATGGYAGTFQCRAESWQRRLKASRCPQKSMEEIRATADSPDKATRRLGIPNDKSETLFAEGVEHYIADVRNTDGRFHLRIVGIDNMPHMVTPFMQTLAWSFLRRFARDPETGEIIDLC